MTPPVSLAEIQQAGVAIEAEEAVAIAQQLIASLRDGGAGPAQPPFGPPTPGTVLLSIDGSVVCRACETTPAVSEIAVLLQGMLPRAGGRVPGGLRYGIARALLDVDVPPFDSLDDFSETLARYERGPRQEAVGRVLRRFDSGRALVPLWAADRRRHPQATQLRRALREADARLYLQHVAAAPAAVAPPPPVQPRAGRAAACVAAGLLMIAAGEFIDGRQRPAPFASVPSAPGPAASHDIALARDDAGATRDRSAAAPADRGRLDDERQSVRPTVKRASRVTRAQASRPGTRRASSNATPRRPASPGVLERLRLNWLRSVFRSS